MIQGRPGIVRDSLIWCQEQTIFAKTIFLQSYKCSYILAYLCAFQVKTHKTSSSNEALLRARSVSGNTFFDAVKTSTVLMHGHLH